MLHWIRDRRRGEARRRASPLIGRPSCGRTWSTTVCSMALALRVSGDGVVFLDEKYWEGSAVSTLPTRSASPSPPRPVCYSDSPMTTTATCTPSSSIPRRSCPPSSPGGDLSASRPARVRPHPGQAFAQGPVILVWDAVLHGARHPEQGHNLVYHEFAHKLDMLDGAADGTPPLAGREQLADWVAVCSREFLRLRHLAEKGHKTFLYAYGATNEAEFFAGPQPQEFFHRPRPCSSTVPTLIEFSEPITARTRQDA